jgi:DNA-binding NarL/FixJ family response regulator
MEILINERNLIFQELLVAKLKNTIRANITTLAAKEGSLILKYLEEHQVDIFIFDPVQFNGYITAETISKLYPKIKKIGFSSHKEDNRIKYYGAISYVSKFHSNVNQFINEVKLCMD